MGTKTLPSRKIPLPTLEISGQYTVRADCHRESYGSFSCTLWTLDGEFFARAYGKTKDQAVKNAIRTAEGRKS